MKKFFFFFLILASVQLSVNAQKLVETTTDIENVTVYLQNAQVAAVAKANVIEGQTEVVFKELPLTLNPQTIQLSSSSNIVILSVSTRINYLAPKRDQIEIKKLEDTINDLNLRLSKIANRKAVLGGLSDLLNANRAVAGSNIGVSPDNLAKVFEYYNLQMMKIKTEWTELDLTEKKLRESLADHQQQLNDRKGTDKTTMEVVALVSSKVIQAASFKINYLVSNAGWSPEYDIRGEGTTKPITLTYKAIVWQNTGMDWDKVKLKISTGNPNQSATGPVFMPWYLNYFYPQILLDEKSNSQSAPRMEMQKKEDMDGEYDKNETPADYTSVSENQLSTTFDIDLPYSIASDGKPKTVIVQEKSIDATYKYYSIPKTDRDAFLLARITGWEDLNLLSGNANVFFEGAYVGQTYLDANSTNDTLNVSLGRDKKIVIRRTKIKDYDKGRLVGDKIKKAVQYEFSIRNNRNEKVEIDIIDQIPIPATSEIEVELVEQGDAVLEPETGKLTWHLNLNPSEEKKVRFAFSVKFPKSKIAYSPKF